MKTGCSIIDVTDLGTRDYGPVLAFQESLVARVAEGSAHDAMLLLEHTPVYTMGRNAKAENIIVPPAELASKGIPVLKTGRGGDVTYHGPGQLVGYPIISLSKRNMGVLAYVSRLESVLIAVLSDFGITAGTDPINHGAWVGQDKIAAIGVRVTRHVTMHGFSLNVRVDMDAYRAIVPCGIRGRGVTSMHRFAPDIRMADVKERMILRFVEHFGYDHHTHRQENG
jgi:lipoyl(octanoyl) transferase